MRAHRAKFPVTVMCRLLGVSTSGYYAWTSRAPSVRSVADAEISQRIEAIHARSDGTYGSPRIHPELRDEGIRIGRKRVARLMRSKNLVGVHRHKGTWTTRRDPKARPAPDLVKRQFEADAPDQLWVADITYVPTWAGFLYLAVVLDVFSRRVVG